MSYAIIKCIFKKKKKFEECMQKTISIRVEHRYLHPLQALGQIRRRHFYQGTRTQRTRLRS